MYKIEKFIFSLKDQNIGSILAIVLFISSLFWGIFSVYKASHIYYSHEYSDIAKIKQKKLKVIQEKILDLDPKTFSNELNSSEYISSLKESYELISSLPENKSEEENLVANFNKYTNYINAYTTPLAVILGFLAISFVIKIEQERLRRERNHYRKQSSDNLSDILAFSLDLMEDIDKKHVDFFYTYRELKEHGIEINLNKLIYIRSEQHYYFKTTKFIETHKDYLDYKNLYSINMHDTLPGKFFSKKYFIKQLEQFIKEESPKEKTTKEKTTKEKTTKEKTTKCKINLDENILFSSRFIRKLYLHKKTIRREELLDYGDELSTVDDNLKALYYTSLSQNFSEYTTKIISQHSLNDEVKKIAPNIESIILKKDFDLNTEEHKNISDAYLRILRNIKSFENIIEGISKIADNRNTEKQIRFKKEEAKLREKEAKLREKEAKLKEEEGT